MLNTNHKSGLLSTFQTVDESLVRAVELLNSFREQSPFSSLVHDGTAVQIRAAAEHVAHIRQAMLKALQAFDIPLSEPRRSSVWAARMSVLSAAVAVEELQPKYLRGYGALLAADAEAVAAHVGEIQSMLERFEALLAGDGLAEQIPPASNSHSSDKP